MKQEYTDTIKTELEESGYDFAIAVATYAEIEAGAACGQLSIITEDKEDEGAKPIQIEDYMPNKN
jgi:hypothetical protein